MRDDENYSVHDLAGHDLEFIAYQLWDPGLEIVTAPMKREWMTATREHFAYRCLPMSIANEYGWMILSDQAVKILWNGSQDSSGMRIFSSAQSRNTPISHFGSGVVTWPIPYLFRTPPGYDLIVRGPTNCCKDGICPLDGVIETDWTVTPFTMNWKITRARLLISFEKGEPIAMILPVRHAKVEEFIPSIRRVSENEEVQRLHQEWAQHRGSTLSELRTMKAGAARTWERNYWEGMSVGSDHRAEHHAVHMRLHRFKATDNIGGSTP